MRKKMFATFVLVLTGVFIVMAQDIAYSRNMEQPGSAGTNENRKQQLVDILKQIQDRYHINFLYEDKLLQGVYANAPVITSKDKLDKALADLLNPLGMKAVKLNDRNYSVSAAKQSGQQRIDMSSVTAVPNSGLTVSPVTDMNLGAAEAIKFAPDRVVKGKVLDDKEEPIEGASVLMRGQKKGISTGPEGNFTLTVPDNVKSLEISHVNYETRIIDLSDNKKDYIIRMTTKANEMGPVVVSSISTGIFNRKIESFTGSASIYTDKELRMAGNQNIIQSLKSLDPSFIVMENNALGSNPNVLPDMEIRGKSSIIGIKDEYSSDPNQPLFVLNGFETDLRTIVDLDMNRVKSVIVLKDAASTAIYGSKAANGVVVVETMPPASGKLNVSVTWDNTVAWPDLRDYNLMDAREKLEFESKLGRYTSKGSATTQARLDELYSARLGNVLRGVNTYWLNTPLRTVAWSPSVSVRVSGGDESFQYSVGAKYGRVNGVMIGSGRDVGNANIDLVYIKNKLKIRNSLAISTYKSEESPYGAFSSFARTNPYYERNSTAQYLETPTPLNQGALDSVPNPLYEATLGNYNTSNQFQITNGLSVIYELTNSFRLEGRMNLIKTITESEVFTSASSATFRKKDITQRGSYGNNDVDYFKYDGYFKGTYGKVFKGIHEVNFVGGFNFNSGKTVRNGYSVTGFPAGVVTSPAFGSGYPEGGIPSYSRVIRREASFFSNFHYGLYGKYMADFTYRRDGSSVFGSNKRFSDTWSAGLAWNLEKESFFKSLGWIDRFKIRGSVGNPGNQSFATYNSYTVYRYLTGNISHFGIGAVVDAWGYPDLPWQKTVNTTVGTDIILFKNRLTLTFDVFRKNTDPMIVKVENPASTGSTIVMMDLGRQETKGFDFRVSVTPFSIPEKRMFVKLNFSGATSNSIYNGFGNALEQLNKQNRDPKTEDGSKDLNIDNSKLVRYKDGTSATALWAVRSNGIDPGTGAEAYLTKDGQETFSFSNNHEVIVGNSSPDMYGTFGITAQYKGFGLNMVMRYSYGSDQFNTALFNKVENIKSSDLNYNQDKRALYDRWYQPGDVAKYRTAYLWSSEGTQRSEITTRFLQKNNYITGESISLSYEFDRPMLKRMGLSRLIISGYMNDIFRFATIKAERGIDYPFQRSFGLSVSTSF